MTPDHSTCISVRVVGLLVSVGGHQRKDNRGVEEIGGIGVRRRGWRRKGWRRKGRFYRIFLQVLGWSEHLDIL